MLKRALPCIIFCTLAAALLGMPARAVDRLTGSGLAHLSTSACNEQQKVTALDGAAFDQFGYSVALSGDTAVIGSRNDDDTGTSSGSAYVFVRSGALWTQQHKLTASDGAAFDQLGQSVALSGDTAVIGSHNDGDAGTSSGSAYVFVRSGTLWTQHQKLTASDGAAEDRFGFSASISGDTALIGAYGDDEAGSASGSAYVFVRSGTLWTQLQKLAASDAAAQDIFGFSVAVSGDTALVGAIQDDDGGSNSGSAYVFVRSGGIWTEQQKLTAGDAAAGDWFGTSVAISGDTAVIGAYLDSHAGGLNAGSAYVFTRSGGVWTQQQKLTASDPQASSNFGNSVSILADTVVVGAPQASAAYIFGRFEGVWTQQQKLTAADGGAGESFGYAVAAGQGTAVVTAFNDDAPATDSGSAYVFSCVPEVLYVNDGAVGLNDGTSWANAFTTLQDALSAAQVGDQIWVAAGTYWPDQGAGQTPGDRSATFQLLNGVTIYGGFAGVETELSQRDAALHETILSGDLLQNDLPVACSQDSNCVGGSGDACIDGLCIINSNSDENSYHVVTGSNTDWSARIDGFTITSGNVNGATVQAAGGGMISQDGEPIVANCTFRDNRGGGMYNSFASTPVVTNCVFRRNQTGMFNHHSSPLVTNCTFESNVDSNFGGLLGGAGLLAHQSSPFISGCIFRGNRALGSGGGGVLIFTNEDFNSILRNCLFTGNIAYQGGGLAIAAATTVPVVNCAFSGNSASEGGGIFNISVVRVVNSTFSGNSATEGAGIFNGGHIDVVNSAFSGNLASFGGGIHTGGSAVVTNSTFSSNIASSEGGGVYRGGAAPQSINNSVFWQNSDSGGMDSSAQIANAFDAGVSWSIVQGGWSGPGFNNLNVDPLFLNPHGADNIVGTMDDDLRLHTGSPGIDSGSDSLVPSDIADLDGDGNTSEYTPLDLAGGPRFLGTVDRGAYENFPVPDAPALEPSGTNKNRYISFVIPEIGAGDDTVIRVELTSLHHPAGPPNAPNFTAFEGEYRYLNAIRDAGNNPVYFCPDSAALGSSFACARLGCSPEYRDWAGIFGGDVVHVTGDSVVPSSHYTIAQLASSCLGHEAVCAASAEVLVATERWGNVDNIPAGGTPNAIDIGFIVSKVKDAPGSFIESRCQLQGPMPNPYSLAVSALDIARGVDAVKGLPYPFTISACP